MRRPVKPFVTEYKGNARRQASTTAPSFMSEDDVPAAAAQQKTFRQERARVAENRSTVSMLPSGDSYEAALRAADALFSGGSTGSQAALAGDRVAPILGDKFSDETASARAPHAPEAAAANPGGGRILRVIDEAPVGGPSDPEAETPKRRGRKPGSKNKPKIVSIVIGALPVTRPPPERTARRAASKASKNRLPSEPAFAAVQAVSLLAPMPVTRPIAAQRPRVEPYAWVRVTLKPGERWKRRLPKVVW